MFPRIFLATLLTVAVAEAGAEEIFVSTNVGVLHFSKGGELLNTIEHQGSRISLMSYDGSDSLYLLAGSQKPKVLRYDLWSQNLEVFAETDFSQLHPPYFQGLLQILHKLSVVLLLTVEHFPLESQKLPPWTCLYQQIVKGLYFFQPNMQ